MPAAGRLVLVTHARTAAARAGVFPADEPLDPAGFRATADASRAVLPGGAPVWSSPFLMGQSRRDHDSSAPQEAAGFRSTGASGPAAPARTGPELRCRQTAVALGLAARVDEGLRDRGHGEWTGRRLADVATAEPAAYEAWLTDPQAAPPGGESLADLVRRVGRWLDRWAAASSGPPRAEVVVTHPAVVRAAVVHALGAPAASLRHLDVGPLTRTDLSHRRGRWTLQLLGASPDGRAPSGL